MAVAVHDSLVPIYAEITRFLLMEIKMETSTENTIINRLVTTETQKKQVK
jgi:hypothetical protein